MPGDDAVEVSFRTRRQLKGSIVRVLVTGASGYIGSHTVDSLLKAGHDVRVLVRSPTRAALSLGPCWARVEVAVGDVTDAASVTAAVDGCDSVVHTAGEIGVAAGTGPGSAAVNVDGLRIVAEAGLAIGADPIVYTSTVMAYLPTDQAQLTSRSPLAAPMSAYGASKIQAEQLVRAWQKDGAPICCFVIGGVYGPGSPHRDGSFAAVLGALRFMMLVPPGGMGVVDVRDLALLLERSVVSGQGPCHFMAGGHFVPWSSWTDLLSEAAGRFVARQEVTADQMIELGRQFDLQRAGGPRPGPVVAGGGHGHDQWRAHRRRSDPFRARGQLPVHTRDVSGCRRLLAVDGGAAARRMTTGAIPGGIPIEEDPVVGLTYDAVGRHDPVSAKGEELRCRSDLSESYSSPPATSAPRWYDGSSSTPTSSSSASTATRPRRWDGTPERSSGSSRSG